MIVTKNSPIILISIFALFLSGAFYIFTCWHQIGKQLKSIENHLYMLEVDPNQIMIDGNQMKFTGIVIETDSQEKVKEKIIIFYHLASNEEKKYWQNIAKPIYINLTGELSELAKATNQHQFDYQKYMRTQGIRYQLNADKLLQVKPIEDWRLNKWIQRLRKQTDLAIRDACPPILGTYMKSLLLGVKDEQFIEVQTLLKPLGILHVFSLSGLHIYFFIFQLRKWLLRFGIIKEHVFWLLLFVLPVYALFVGGTTSIVRAVVTTILSLINQHKRLGFTSLDIWSFSLMLACLNEPLVLGTIAGQLSYGLTLFLIFLRPALAKENNTLLENFKMSFWLGIISMPILLYHFYEFNLGTIGLNFIFVPLFSQIILPMLACLGMILWFSKYFYFIYILLMKIFLLVEVSLHMLHNFFDWLQRIQVFQIATGALWFWQSLFLFIGLFVLFAVKSKQKRILWMSLLLVFLIGLTLRGYWQNQGKISIIDIGQGDAIVVQLPHRKGVYLIDTGGQLSFMQENWQKRNKKMTPAQKSLIPYLKGEGIKTIDGIFLSHGDADHVLYVYNPFIHDGLRGCFFILYLKGAQKGQSYLEMSSSAFFTCSFISFVICV